MLEICVSRILLQKVHVVGEKKSQEKSEHKDTYHEEMKEGSSSSRLAEETLRWKVFGLQTNLFVATIASSPSSDCIHSPGSERRRSFLKWNNRQQEKEPWNQGVKGNAVWRKLKTLNPLEPSWWPRRRDPFLISTFDLHSIFRALCLVMAWLRGKESSSKTRVASEFYGVSFFL